MIYAIVAHYDPKHEWDQCFLTLLEQIKEIAAKIIVVTTSQRVPDLPQEYSAINLIRRPNIGYDFYSYRVGIEEIASECSCSGFFLVNSSVIVLDRGLFLATLRLLVRRDPRFPFRGATQSRQFDEHLQSYLLYFDLAALNRNLVISFFRNVEPLNSKLEIILHYEIGLSKFLKQQNILHRALYRPSLYRKLKGSLDFIMSCLRSEGPKIVLKASLYRPIKQINWTHFGAKDIAQKFGFVKAEILRNNPHNISQFSILKACCDSLSTSVSASIDEKKAYYSSKPSGLTELDIETEETGLIRESIDCRSHHEPSRKIAVALHLYYCDLYEEVLRYLETIIEPYDLYVSTPFERDIPSIIDSSAERGIPVTILYTVNKGRDIGPFIALYRTGKLNEYDAVLKIHTKKSTYSKEGPGWRTELFKSLCGSSMISLRSIMLLRSTSCGIIGPSSYFLTRPEFIGSNAKDLSNILNDCGVSIANDTAPELAFFAGSMFWFSPKALAAIHSCKERSLRFQAENGLQDGTLAHAWERAFCLIAKDSKYNVSSIAHGGKSIFNDTNNIFNNVPVLPQTST